MNLTILHVEREREDFPLVSRSERIKNVTQRRSMALLLEDLRRKPADTAEAIDNIPYRCIKETPSGGESSRFTALL